MSCLFSQYCDSGRNVPNFRQTLPITSKFNSKVESSETDEEGDDADSQPSSTLTPPFPESAASSTEWIGITTNSEECSYSSCDNSESQLEYSENGGGEYDSFTPTVILNSGCGLSDRSKSAVRNEFNEALIHWFALCSQLHHLGWKGGEKG